MHEVHDPFDIERVSDFLAAKERWAAGDSRRLVQFVLRWGVESEYERAFVVQALTTKPDARLALKPGTERMLGFVQRLINQRDRLTAEAAHLAQVYGIDPRVPTEADLYANVAEKCGVDPGTVRRAWQRNLSRT